MSIAPILRALGLWPLAVLIPLLTICLVIAGISSGPLAALWLLLGAAISIGIGLSLGSSITASAPNSFAAPDPPFDPKPASSQAAHRGEQVAASTQPTVQHPRQQANQLTDIEASLARHISGTNNQIIQELRSLRPLLSGPHEHRPHTPSLDPVLAKLDDLEARQNTTRQKQYAKLLDELYSIQNKQKGDAFEEFMVRTLANTDSELLHWRGDKICFDDDDNILSPTATTWPDLEWRCKHSGKHFAVECKWRRSWQRKDPKVQIAKDPRKMSDYLSFGTERGIPVFIALGIGGSPDNPRELYLIKLTEAWLARSNPSYTHMFWQDAVTPHQAKPHQKLFFHPSDEQLRPYTQHAKAR